MRRVFSKFLTNPASTIQLLITLGISGFLTAAGARMVSASNWLGGWYLVTAAVSAFFVLLAIGLALVPRVWLPKGPFADYFGTAAVMVGINEEIDKRVFRRVPQLKRECAYVGEHLARFVEERAKEMPPAPPPSAQDPSHPTPAQHEYNLAVNAAIEKTSSLYASVWRQRVERLFADARAMFFGPVPVNGMFPDIPGRPIHPDEIRAKAAALAWLAEILPSSYSDELHTARVERLRRLKHDGITLAYEIGRFLAQRQQEAMAVLSPASITVADDEAGGQLHSRQQWERERAFDKETSAQFISEYAGRLRNVSEGLEQFGLVDPAFERLFRWPGLSISGSVHELAPLPAVLAALCQRIPYD